MNKEEIIQNLFDFYSEEGHRENYPTDFEDFSKDIDNLIKESAIPFAEWVEDRIYNNVLAKVKAYGSRYFGQWTWHPVGQKEAIFLTTAELFTLYLETNINK